MPFFMFVITTILTLCIIFSLVGIGMLKLNHLKIVKNNWPELSNSQLLMRHQRIFNYRMNRQLKAVYQYYEDLILKMIMLVTFGISIGGYLIDAINLTLIPLIVLSFELSIYYFMRSKINQSINDDYREYIRKNLNNELMVVTIPEQILKGLIKIKTILGWLFILEGGSILIIVLEINQIIKY